MSAAWRFDSYGLAGLFSIFHLQNLLDLLTKKKSGLKANVFSPDFRVFLVLALLKGV